jgi:hypothetical protein
MYRVNLGKVPTKESKVRSPYYRVVVTQQTIGGADDSDDHEPYEALAPESKCGFAMSIRVL